MHLKANISTDLRSAQPADEEFLFSVFASTRAWEMALVDWDTGQKESFLRMQFAAQDQYYRANYPGAQFQVILLEDQPVGRLYIHRRADEIRIMDIALLPEFQKRGIGSRLLQQILEEAQQQELPVTIHVERFNPALHLYVRLGFRFVEDKDVYYFMKWSPEWEEEHDHTG